MLMCMVILKHCDQIRRCTAGTDYGRARGEQGVAEVLWAAAAEDAALGCRGAGRHLAAAHAARNARARALHCLLPCVNHASAQKCLLNRASLLSKGPARAMPLAKGSRRKQVHLPGYAQAVQNPTSCMLSRVCEAELGGWVDHLGVAGHVAQPRDAVIRHPVQVSRHRAGWRLALHRRHLFGTRLYTSCQRWHMSGLAHSLDRLCERA